MGCPSSIGLVSAKKRYIIRALVGNNNKKQGWGPTNRVDDIQSFFIADAYCANIKDIASFVENLYSCDTVVMFLLALPQKVVNQGN